jgi:hypothetical protein
MRLPSDLTTELLVAAPAAPDPLRLQAEILKLDRLIDQAKNRAVADALGIAFQALNWARAPDSFAPPSAMTT